ncbi:MAG: DUF2812 domain-containing protein [Erysipelotrichaceae bacterium]|nr:DUF2812 domain-containing protein [Erysipelotrichaceae bacterium]
MNRTMIRFFTIADFEDEEIWLRQQHQQGLKLVKMTIPCFYTFEECEPQDVIYRLDYRNGLQDEEYMRMFKDFGWECFDECLGWLYFRKPAFEVNDEEEGEIFSDNMSRIGFVENIIKTRLIPLCVIFLCCVIPNLLNSMNGRLGGYSEIFTVIFSVMFMIYVYLIIHCSLKLKNIRDRYSGM